MSDALPWIFGGVAGGLIATSMKNKDKGSSAAAAADQRQKDLENSLKDQQKNQESQANKNSVRDAAAAKQKAAAAGSYGRNSTILTNPLGVPNNPADEQKTILG